MHHLEVYIQYFLFLKSICHKMQKYSSYLLRQRLLFYKLLQNEKTKFLFVMAASSPFTTFYSEDVYQAMLILLCIILMISFSRWDNMNVRELLFHLKIAAKGPEKSIIWYRKRPKCTISSQYNRIRLRGILKYSANVWFQAIACDIIWILSQSFSNSRNSGLMFLQKSLISKISLANLIF